MLDRMFRPHACVCVSELTLLTTLGLVLVVCLLTYMRAILWNTAILSTISCLETVYLNQWLLSLETLLVPPLLSLWPLDSFYTEWRVPKVKRRCRGAAIPRVDFK